MFAAVWEAFNDMYPDKEVPIADFKQCISCNSEVQPQESNADICSVALRANRFMCSSKWGTLYYTTELFTYRLIGLQYFHSTIAFPIEINAD
jgi:hypothetical protein